MSDFTFKEEWYDVISALPSKEMQADAAYAIIQYAMTGEVDSNYQFSEALVGMIRDKIDISVKRRNAGSEGGKSKANRKQPCSKSDSKMGSKPCSKSVANEVANPPLSPSSLSPEPPITTPPISPSSTTTTTPAYTREEQFPDWDEGIDDLEPKEKSCAKKEIPSGTYITSEHLVKVLLADRRWVANVAKNKGLTEEVVRNFIIEFCEHIGLTEGGKELSDAKRHFINWLRKKLNGEQAQQRPTRPYQNPEPDFRSVAEAVARGIAAARTNQG
jgi:hypothetical protein